MKNSPRWRGRLWYDRTVGVFSRRFYLYFRSYVKAESFLQTFPLAYRKIYHVKTCCLFRKETVMHTSKNRNSIKENELKDFNYDLYTQIIEKIFAQRDLKTVRLTIGEAVLTAEATGVREDNALILDAIKHTLLRPDAYLNMWEMRCLAGNGDFYQYVDFDPFMLSMSVMIGLPSGCAVRRTTFDLNENMAEGNFAHLYDYSNGDDHTTNDIDEAIEFG